MKTTALVFLLFFAVSLAAQDTQSCPMHKQHLASSSGHATDLEQRGNQGMGFRQDKTTHHFRLYADGGAIEVTADDSSDVENVQAIRSHLTHIAESFSHGNFSIPMFVHDQVPPGVLVMQQRQAAIAYLYEELAAGGTVRIKTANADALQGVHDFLRFQIADHQTGDTTDISSPAH